MEIGKALANFTDSQLELGPGNFRESKLKPGPHYFFGPTIKRSIMTEQAQSLLTIDSFEDFEAGNNASFVLEEGSYDGAIVCGYTLNKANFEGKERILIQLIWQLVDDEGNVHTLRGNGWSISASEKSKLRIELTKWFDTQDWGKVCEILVKG